MKLYRLLPLLVVAVSAFAAGFSKEEMSGLRLSLVDEKRLEIYRFGDGDVASVQIGKKDGAVAGPSYHWKIENGKIVFTVGKYVKESFELIERSEKGVKLRRQNGKVEYFDVERVGK